MVLTVAVQAEQQLVREGIALVLADEPDIEIAGTAADAAEITRICEATRPDVVVLELDARAWDPFSLIARLRKRQRTLKVVAIAADALSLQVRAQRAGVSAVISHDASISALTRAVRARAVSGQLRRLPTPVASHATRRLGEEELTTRQRQVLEMIGAGCTAAEIAAELGISAKTVENHKQQVFRRLGVHNQSHAVAIAIRRGLIRSGVVNARGVGS